MAARTSSSFGRKIALLGIVMLGLCGVAGIGGAWLVTHPPRGHFCTAAGTLGPVADTPEEAFELFWAQAHPEGPTIAESDIDRDGNTWTLDEGDDRFQKIEVGSADHFGMGPADKWAVYGSNHCSYD